MNIISFYTHNSYDASKIREQLRVAKVPEAILEELTEELGARFYEAEFSVTYDKEGHITHVKLEDPKILMN